jgi:hypothetical protein
MDLPKHIVQSQLYSRIHEDQELFSALFSMRSIVLSLAETTGRTVPDFTDHTVRHMDALWFVAEQILTPAEIDNLTPAEAFLIGAAFYLHDIGMAYAATKEGIISIKGSPAYRAAMVQGRSAKIPMLEARALGIAIRAMHADAAKELATNEIPGSAGRYLFEALSFREAWGQPAENWPQAIIGHCLDLRTSWVLNVTHHSRETERGIFYTLQRACAS